MRRSTRDSRQFRSAGSPVSQGNGARWFVRGGLAVALGAAIWAWVAQVHAPAPGDSLETKRRKIAQALTSTLEQTDALPARIALPAEDESGDAGVNSSTEYSVATTIDPELQSRMEALLGQYNPDYAAFVAIEPETGRIRALVSHTNDPEIKGHLALRATFPSASVFKVVTAAAAIAEAKMSPESVIAFNGRNHTLYKSNIVSNPSHRWTRFMTLREAFGKSVNTVFGRIGAFSVGPERLRDYAERFGFNVQIPSDLPVQEGHAQIEADSDAWELAETASGFTRESTMSPLQGAMIASAVANDGRLMVPYAVESLADANGNVVYTGAPEVAREVVDGRTASKLRELMRTTVVAGTSRKSFRGFFRGAYAEADVGGKTGSLTGTDPQGKYDWFVGYGQLGGRSLAVAALTVNTKQWRVKSSWLARRSLEIFLDPRRLGSKSRELAQAAPRSQGRTLR